MQPIESLVYADWLLAQGNLQGELITVQVARQSAARTPAAQRALRLREEELLAKHGAELAGPLPRKAELCWRGGFVRDVLLEPTLDELELLPRVLARPAFAMLERLAVHLPPDAADRIAGLVAAIATAPKTLRAVAIRGIRSLDLDLRSLPRQLERLDLAGFEVTLQLPELPALTSLHLIGLGEAEGLDPARQPKLARVVCDTLVPLHRFRGLEVHLWSDDPGVDLAEVAARRVVVTTSEPGELPPGRITARLEQQAEERAFLLFEDGAYELERAIERLRKTPLDGTIIAAWRTLRIGARNLTAVELRSNEPQPSLLRLLANDLAGALQRGVLEVAESPSSSTYLLRGHERIGTTVTSWVIGRSGGNLGLRRAVDRLFGFDPGLRALEDVLLELDGANPVEIRGALPKGSEELPCCSPLEADFHNFEEEDDEDPEDAEYEDEDPYYDVYEAQPDAAPAEVLVARELVEDAEEDPDDDPDEPHRDAADADIHELLTESPVDLDDEPEDGLEPKTETGLEQEVSVDGVSEVVVCETCRRHEAHVHCHLCNAEVCEACLSTEAPPTCRECRATATHQDNAAPRASAPTFMRRSR